MSIHMRHPHENIPLNPEETSTQSLGITFHLKNGQLRFLPHPFLTAVDLVGSTQITFHYTHCIVTVKGQHLRGYLSLIESMKLRKLEEQVSTPSKEGVPVVESIHIQDDKSASASTSFPDVPLPY